jgi:hypothetical protein
LLVGSAKGCGVVRRASRTDSGVKVTNANKWFDHDCAARRSEYNLAKRRHRDAQIEENLMI